MGNIDIEFLGGAGEVQRSCAHLSTSDSDILIDCGLKQNETSEYPDLTGLNDIDTVLLTHAHIDHSGGLPLLTNLNLLKKNAPIYCTPPTALIVKPLLWDSFKLQKKEWDEKNQEYLYETEDVKEVLNKIITVPYHTFTPTDDIEAEFGNAGHILGSSWIHIRTGGKKILFTGDIGEGRSTHLPRPSKPPKSDILVMESTYGAMRQHPSFSDDSKKLVNIASEEVPILIPSFAVGRSQEVLRILKTRGNIDSSRIYYDGMVNDIFPAYRTFACEMYMSKSLVNSIHDSGKPKPFTPQEACTPKTMEDRRKIARFEKAPIIVTPSGMLQGGWSTFYLKELVKRGCKFKVALVGYQTEGSPGRKLQENKDNGEEIQVTLNALMEPGEANGDVEKLGFHNTDVNVPSKHINVLKGFSTHASANSLLEFARKCLPREIFLVHGSKDSFNSLKEIISNENTLKHAKTTIPQINEKFEFEENSPKSLEKKIVKLEERISNLEDSL